MVTAHIRSDTVCMLLSALHELFLINEVSILINEVVGYLVGGVVLKTVSTYLQVPI